MATHEPLHSLSSASTVAAPPPSRPTSSVKVLAESPALKSIPSKYAYFINGNNDDSTTASSDPPQASIPVIDLSHLDSGSPHQRLKFIQSLDRACQDWGFFMVVNHGVPETLMKKMTEVSKEFFNLPEEEKMKLETKNVLDPLRCGTSFNAVKEEVFFWRDFLKVFVHPNFHSPINPQNFSEVLLEYSKKTREMASKLLEGISESLGLEPEQGYMKKELHLESSLQIFTANYYPPCPQPEFAIGMPPHSDHGLLTILLQNEVGGLQIQHKGKWINVDPLPNSFLVNTGDHLEIFSNGRYKSVLHRATVNNEKTRISLAITNGSSLEATVKPATKLVNNDDNNNNSFPKYNAMKYKEYLEVQQGNKLDGKSCLDRVKIYTG